MIISLANLSILKIQFVQPNLSNIHVYTECRSKLNYFISNKDIYRWLHFFNNHIFFGFYVYLVWFVKMRAISEKKQVENRYKIIEMWFVCNFIVEWMRASGLGRTKMCNIYLIIRDFIIFCFKFKWLILVLIACLMRWSFN